MERRFHFFGIDNFLAYTLASHTSCLTYCGFFWLISPDEPTRYGPRRKVTPMTLSDFYNEVARLADTDKTQISAADTKRVLAVAFSVLQKHDPATVLDLVSKGLAAAKKKEAK